MENAESTLPRKVASRWAIAICAFTGALGVFTGFAIFILLRPAADNDPWTLWLGLAAAAFASFIVEMLRDSLRGEVLDVSAPGRVAQVVVTLLTLAVFELFVFATHNAVDIARHPTEVRELRDAILGPVLQGTAGATRDLVVLALLWVITGAVVGAVLGAVVFTERTALKLGRRELYAGFTGLLAGAIAAPLAVVGYVLLWRVVRVLSYDPLFLFRRLDAFSNPELARPVFEPTHSWVAAAGRTVLMVSTLLVQETFAKIIVAVLLAACVALGAWRKVWWPLVALLFFLALGILAPLGLDVRDVVSLPVLAAIVWIVPGAILGLAVPLLDRPSERTTLWSSIAAMLGLAVAAITLLRLHDPRYFVLALLLFTIASIFFTRRDIEQYWPALALCLAIASTGLSVAVLHFTASFHQVLAQVSRVNALPSFVDQRAPTSEADRFLLELPGRPYTNRLAQARAAGNPEQLRSAADDLDAAVAAERNVDLARLVAISSEKQRYLRENNGAAGARDAYYHSLDGVTQLKVVAADQVVAHERHEAEDRRDLAGSAREATFWAHYYDSTVDLTDDIQTLDQAIIDLPAVHADIEREARVREEQRSWERAGVAQQLEIALAGSTAFWMTVGLLAAWALRRRTKISDVPPRPTSGTLAALFSTIRSALGA